tara:strand:- start:2116 stop:2508 length:393 start_codon:yes stop_codon:yes gene_type:complete
MRTIKFQDLVSHIPTLEFDGDETDKRMHSQEQYNWGAKDEADYKEAEKSIDSLSKKGNGWELYCWSDVSGWDYWMNNQGESNYIMTTISFDKSEVDETEIESIKTALDEILYDAECISETYSYMPELETE